MATGGFPLIAPRTARRMAPVLGSMAIVGFAAAGCDSPVDLDPDLYTLTSVNEQSLPAPYPDPYLPTDSQLAVASGTLRLNDDGTLDMELVIQCASPLRPDTTCEVEGDGRRAHRGHYSPWDDYVHIEARQYPAEFLEDRVRITFQKPMSQGLGPVYVAEFRR